MNKIIMAITVLVVAPTLIGGTNDAAYAKLTPEQKREVFMNETGGWLLKPGTGKGKIAIVNAQKKCPSDELKVLAKDLSAMTEYNAYYAQGSDALSQKPVMQIGKSALAETGANLAVVVVSADPNEVPPMLVAPEARWAVVNVMTLENGLPDGKLRDVIFAARCRKEAMRAYSIICGGWGSQYQGTIVNAVTPEELDRLEESIPLDNILAGRKYTEKLGVTNRRLVTYRKAYVAGWAPFPTNSYQRACVRDVEEIRAAHKAERARREAEKQKK